jgi:hypothetical protein
MAADVTTSRRASRHAIVPLVEYDGQAFGYPVCTICGAWIRRADVRRPLAWWHTGRRRWSGRWAGTRP